MPGRTVPGRRVVVASEQLAETVDDVNTQDFDRPEPETKAPTILRKLNFRERLTRRLEMADMALEKYEKKLRDTSEGLTLEEERLFLAHQDSIRKLEATLAQLEAKDKSEEEKTPVELALDMIDGGMPREDVFAMLRKLNPGLIQEVVEALNERE